MPDEQVDPYALLIGSEVVEGRAGVPSGFSVDCLQGKWMQHCAEKSQRFWNQRMANTMRPLTEKLNAITAFPQCR